MSSIALQGGATGTGVVSLLAPSTSTNRTLTLPDATGTVLVSGDAIAGTTGTFSGNLSFNSGYGSAAVGYGCRAWAKFTGGVGGGVGITGGANVSSFTKNSTGNYTLFFTNAMPDGLYAASCQQETGNVTLDNIMVAYNYYSASFNMISSNVGVAADFRTGSAAIFR